MEFDGDDFRLKFPEFGSKTDYPPDLLKWWSGVASDWVSEDIWKSMYLQALYLATAHYLALSRRNRLESDSGGTPGSTVGLISSKSAGDVSISYAVEAGTDKFQGTSYGQQFNDMARLIGVRTVMI